MENSIGEIYIDNELYVERNEPEAYRHKHFPKPPKISLDELWLAMEEARVTMFITVKSILYHCYSLEDARLSISQMRNNRPEYWR
jgi:hypothetical protein